VFEVAFLALSHHSPSFGFGHLDLCYNKNFLDTNFSDHRLRFSDNENFEDNPLCF